MAFYGDSCLGVANSARDRLTNVRLHALLGPAMGLLLNVALLLSGQMERAETTGATSPNPGVVSGESLD